MLIELLTSSCQVTSDPIRAATLERYMDLNNATIPDYVTAGSGAATLDAFYKWRIVANSQFSP